MIIGFLPPSNWKGANLVTHELHRRKKKCSLEMRLQCVFLNSSSCIYCRGQTGAQLYRAEPIVLAGPLEGSFTISYPGSGPVIQGSGRHGHNLEGSCSKQPYTGRKKVRKRAGL